MFKGLYGNQTYELAPVAFKVTGLENLGKLLDIHVVGLFAVILIGKAVAGLSEKTVIDVKVLVQVPPLEPTIVKLPGPVDMDC